MSRELHVQPVLVGIGSQANWIVLSKTKRFRILSYHLWYFLALINPNASILKILKYGIGTLYLVVDGMSRIGKEGYLSNI